MSRLLRSLLLVAQPWLLAGSAARSRPSKVAAWGDEDVAAWLEELGLGAHVPAFRRERVDGAALLELTAAELKEELGVGPLGVRKRLLREVNSLRSSEAADVSRDARAAVATSAQDAADCPATCGGGVPEPQQRGWGFDFGGNWLRFLEGLLEEESPMGMVEAEGVFNAVQVRRLHLRIIRFATALIDDYGLSSLTGLTFLDVGTGHGLASLAALHLNASRVVSTDLDTRPVRELRKIVASREELGLFLRPWQTWSVVEGSILNTSFVLSGELPKADLVWSYGVLHHTGNLSLALQNVARLVQPAGLMKIELHTSEEMPFLSDWLEFKRDWRSRPNWYKEEALIAYMFSELWGEMQERIHMDRLEMHFPGVAHSGGFFGRFESVRHVVHSRFWHYTKGRGMDFVIDAVDWLGGHPYEMWRASDIVAALLAADPPLKAIHATYAGFTGLLLTPAAPSLGWIEATGRALHKFSDQVLYEPEALWFKSRKLLPITAQAIDNFSSVLDNNCEGMVDYRTNGMPQSIICAEEFLSQIKGHGCWITFFGAKGVEKDDMSLFMFLEDGKINGWGAPNMSLCVPDTGASFRFFSSGVLLFTVRDGTDPRTNGRSYHILSPE